MECYRKGPRSDANPKSADGRISEFRYFPLLGLQKVPPLKALIFHKHVDIAEVSFEGGKRLFS